MYKKWTLTVSILLLALFGFGCSKGAVSTGKLSTATPEATAQSHSGGEITIAIPQNPSSYDPLSQDTKEMSSALSLVFESLISYDQTNKLVPCLAENWKVDETGKVWTVNLRKGVKWQSGDVFTAADVIHTFSKLTLLGENSYYNHMLKWVESYEAVDAYTFKITGVNKGEQVLHALTIPIISEKNSGKTLPVGTGPYTVESVKWDGMELIANKNWWKRPPYIEKIHCVGRTDNETALASIDAKQLDLLFTSSLSAGKHREEGLLNVMDVMSQTNEVLLINYNKTSLFKDIKVKQALAYAIDRPEIISKAYQNHAFASDVPIPPDSWLYDAKYKVYDTNIEKAKQLLEEAGWKDQDGDGFVESGNTKFECKLLVNDTTGNTIRKEVAALIAAQLQKIGIKIEIVKATYEPFAKTPVLDYETKLSSGDFELALAGFNMNRGGDLRFLLSKNGSSNFGGYSNSEMETLLSNAAQETGENRIKEDFAKLQEKFIADLPFINLYFRTSSLIYAARIKGIADIREEDLFRTISEWHIDETSA